jgi:hypothetical protein
MKIAILSNKANSFPLLLAKGLKRMFVQIGSKAEIFCNLSFIKHSYSSHQQSIQERVKTIIASVYHYHCLCVLNKFDVIVIVWNIPGAFLKSNSGVEIIRKKFPDKPVILYSNYYLPTRGQWDRLLKEGSPEHGIQEGGNYGLERYDWHLTSSVVSENPMPKGYQPYSLIGLNLDDGMLYPENKNEFIALIDFERPNYMNERAIQIQALEETNTKYIVLNGQYPISEIRKIYRKCSLYFLAHWESFGLPICELQACGSYIFTPYAYWCQAHSIKKDIGVSGLGKFSPNFIIYNNDKDILIKEINKIKATYNPKVVFDTFKQYHPQLLYGDMNELTKFIEMVKQHKINGNSHNKYR